MSLTDSCLHNACRKLFIAIFTESIYSQDWKSLGDGSQPKFKTAYRF